jgi:penicillin-binding protein 1A
MGEDRNAFKPASPENPKSTPRHETALLEDDARPTRSDRMRHLLRTLQAMTRTWKWPRPGPRSFLWAGRIAGGLAVAAFVGFTLLYAVLKMAEPAIPMNADLYALNRPPSYTFVDNRGKRVGFKGPIVGDRLSLSDMPPYLPAAFLAVEDRRFYDHHGIDLRGLFRAAMTDIAAGGFVQGGSTITQQLVKMLVLTPERTVSRKVTEIAGALALERRLSKNQILELYLNRIYLGAGAYGVDGAARVYFGKSARNVTLGEAAMLASLTTAPSAFSPKRDLAAARARTARVLASMVAAGAISQSDLSAARAHPANIVEAANDDGRDYFLDTAADEARMLAGPNAGDLTIVTTFDAAMQKAAQTSLTNVMNRRGKAVHASQAAIVAMATDGAVRALIGGRKYSESPFNRITQAHRQPGSAFKPMVYLAALEHGLRPWTIRTDAPITIENWSPDNFGGTHRGDVSLEEAMARSINSVAVELGQEVGLNTVIAVAQRLGIQSPLAPNASLALGTSEVTPLELTGAYASFATAGLKATPYTVTQIRNAKGTVIYRRAEVEPWRVIREDDAMALNAMLYQVVQWGTGRAANVPGREVAGKTGTSTDFHDAWFVGFSAQLVTGVWVGNDDSSPMKNVTGGSLPAQIWTGFMRTALKGTKPLPLPKSIVTPPPSFQEAPQDAPRVARDNRDRGAVGEVFDGIGDFFDRLFSDNRSRDRNPPPPPRRDYGGYYDRPPPDRRGYYGGYYNDPPPRYAGDRDRDDYDRESRSYDDRRTYGR